jgi:hypothetical protein
VKRDASGLTPLDASVFRVKALPAQVVLIITMVHSLQCESGVSVTGELALTSEVEAKWPSSAVNGR